MRIRSGFVSNSSSTSFIVGECTDLLLREALRAIGEKHISVRDVAMEMLRASGRVNTLETLEKDPTDYDHIMFRSCNEDTEIFLQEDGTIAITTCNNEYDAWKIAMDEIESKFRTPVKYMGEDWCYEVQVPVAKNKKEFKQYESASWDGDDDE